MNTHTIELAGYRAKAPDWPALYLGTAGSYGNEQLAVTLGKGWEGLTVTATFQPTGVTVLVPGDGTLDVPWEATETALDAAKGRIVFEGVTDGRVLISTDIPYAVGSHSDTEGSNSQPPTPSQWEQYVDKIKGDANRAEQAAKDAEAALQDVKDAGAQAVTDIGGAKDSALDAIAKAGEETAGSITADVQAAKDAAAAAAQSAKDAAAELPKVQQAGQTALDDIATERENSLTALEDEGDKQQSAVAGAGASALEAIQQAGQSVTGQITQTGATQVGAVQSAGTTQVGLVNSAGQQQAENIAQAGSQQVQAVQTAGTAAVGAVNDARDDAVEEIETANAHAPQINSTTGYWQTWDADTGQYVDTTTKAQGDTPQLTIGTVTTLEPGEDATASITGTAEAPVLSLGIPEGEAGLGVPTPTANDYAKAPTVNAAGTGYELTGPYAPLSTAIVETAKGSMAVCEDSIEWPLQGMRVYGKSKQVSTTGAQLFDISTASLSRDAYGLTFSFDGEYFHADGIVNITDGGSLNTRAFRIVNVPAAYAEGTKAKIFDVTASNCTINEIKLPTGDTTDLSIVLVCSFSANNTETHIRCKIMVSEDTPTEWEPYTGGKPSPSPDYPQEIISAGDDGEISITLSDSGEQSQSLTFSTPDGLPGIPVDSGGNFVDADGQEWICNYRDWARGVDVKKVENKTIDNTEEWVQTATNDSSKYRYRLLQLTKFEEFDISKGSAIKTNGFCDILPITSADDNYLRRRDSVSLNSSSSSSSSNIH